MGHPDAHEDTIPGGDLACLVAHLQHPRTLMLTTHARAIQTSLAVGMSIVVTVGLIAPAHAAIPGDPADDRPAVGALREPSSSHNSALDTERGQVPAFSVSVGQRIHGRAGGRALVDVSLPRRKAPGVGASSLKVRLSGPTGVRVADAGEYTPHHGTNTNAVADWTCTPVNSGKDRECAYTANGGVLASGVIPDPLSATLAISESVTPGSARIVATATWVEDQVAPGQTGEATDTVVGTRVQNQSDSVALAVDEKLSVSLTGLNGAVMHTPASGGSAEDRTGRLVAAIGNIDGRDAKATWSQQSGPSVTFGRDLTVDQPAGTIAQTFEVPAGTPSGTQLTFRVDVESTGHRVSDTTTIRVLTHAPATNVDPRTATVADLAAATTRAPAGDRSGLKFSTNHYRSSIAGKGVKHYVVSKPGKALKRKKLTMTHSAGVSKVRWSVVSGRKSLLKRSTKKKNAITIRVPRKPGLWLIRGNATLRNGDKISRTKIIRVKRPTPQAKRAGRAADLRALEVRAPSADSSSTASFCSLKGGDKISFADGSALTLPRAFSVPAKCTSTSSAPFSGASFSYNGTTFGSVNGSIAGSVVKLASATFSLPQAVAGSLPSGVPTSFTVTPPASTPVTATQQGGSWGAWTGSFATPWLSFLPVPTGWSTPNGLLTLAPQVTKGQVTGALLTFSQESSASDGSGGTASFDFTLSTSGPSDITITAANLGVFQTSTGDHIEFSGTATFFLSKGAQNSLTVSMNCSAPDASGNCPVAAGFSLSNGATLTWTQGAGIALTKAVTTIGSGPSAYQVALAGTYNGVGNWSVSVSNNGSPWAIGTTGVSLTDFAGSVAETTSSAGSSDFSVALSAAVANLNVGSGLTMQSDPTARISNQCAADDSDCTPGQLVVAIDVDATASFLTDELDFNASATLNLSTMQFEFDATETVDVDFGPAGFNITSATMTLTNESITGSCQEQGSASTPTDGSLSLGISASGTAYGQPISINGDINSDGYCLWAALGDYSSGVFSGDDVLLAYSSYAAGADLVLPANAGDSTASAPSTQTTTVSVPTGTILLTGSAELPESAMSSLGLAPGSVTFTAQADVNLSSFTATATYSVDSPRFIGGDSETNTMGVELTSIVVKIGLTTSPTAQASLSLDIDGDVVVASDDAVCSADSANQPDACSYTPVGGSIGVVLSGTSFSVNLQLGVDGTTSDAFGEQGLTVEDLAISASAAVPGGLSLAFNADATLPSSWTQDVALVNNAPVTLAFDLSETSPCIQFAIGEEETGTTYLDIDNAGIVTASYVSLVIAPTGCTIPVGSNSSKQIPAGYSFAFDGDVLGDTTTVALSVDFAPTTRINAQLDLASFELLGVLDVDNTLFNLDMNGPGSLTSSFSGGFSLGDPSIAGGQVNVAGDVITNGSGNFTLVLGGSGSINLGDIAQASVTSDSGTCPSWVSQPPGPGCIVALQQVDGSIRNADISANINLGLLGADLAGQVDLIYSDSSLQDFHLGLGANISFWVGSVGGTAYIDYCSGDLRPNSNGTTDASSCTIGGSSDTFRIYFDGSYEIGPCGDHWYDDACWTDSFSDTVINTTVSNPSATAAAAANTPRAGKQRIITPASADTSGLDVTFGISSPAGVTSFAHPAVADYSPNLLWNHASVIGAVGTVNGNDVQATATVALSALQPAAHAGLPGCDTSAAGISWLPTEAEPNPAPQAPAAHTSDCALDVAYMTPGSTVVSEFGGSGQVIPNDQFDAFAEWATTNSQTGTLRTPGDDWFNTPQAGYATCTSGAQGQCTLFDADGNNLGAIFAGGASGPTPGGSVQAAVQLVSGLNTPMGSIPSGLTLTNGQSVWAPDGSARLSVTDGVATLWVAEPGSGYPNDNNNGISEVWSAGTTTSGGYLAVAPDGRIHLRDSNGTSYWSSGSPSAAVSGSPFAVVGGPNGLSVADGSHLDSPLWHL